MIARDAGWTPKPGLEVDDKDGHKVGNIDQASDAQGWMQVEALGLGLRVWTADGQEAGRIREFDVTMGYALIEKGVLSRQRDVLIPVHLVADVHRDEGAVTLAVRMADLERMRHFAAVNVIVDLPAYLRY